MQMKVTNPSLAVTALALFGAGISVGQAQTTFATLTGRVTDVCGRGDSQNHRYRQKHADGHGVYCRD